MCAKQYLQASIPDACRRRLHLGKPESLLPTAEDDAEMPGTNQAAEPIMTSRKRLQRTSASMREPMGQHSVSLDSTSDALGRIIEAADVRSAGFT
jgi:hypothetical protein